MMEHISRSWGKDAFAPQCGCTLLPCGMVDTEEGDRLECDQHAGMAGKTIRSSHDRAQCPSVVWTDLEDGIHQKGVLLTTFDNDHAVTMHGFVRTKPGLVTIHDPNAITLRSFGHDD